MEDAEADAQAAAQAGRAARTEAGRRAGRVEREQRRGLRGRAHIDEPAAERDARLRERPCELQEAGWGARWSPTGTR